MKITIEFSTDNDAFVENKDYEANRVLDDAFTCINQGRTAGNLWDSDGYNIGQWKVEE